jgi:Polyketide cyclase / dehydrase and lipid transport
LQWSIESVREAALTPAEIFRFYVDPSTWGEWGHNTRWARADGPVVKGAHVDVKAGYGRVWPVLIRELVSDRYVECEVRPPGMLVVNRYEVQPVDGGVRLRHGIEVSGPLARVTKLLRFDRLYRRLLAKEIRRLIELATAERRG